MSEINKRVAATLAAARMQSLAHGHTIEIWVDEYERFLEELKKRDEIAKDKRIAEQQEIMRKLTE